jgi:patatin-like phospholipase/acyl hydrolase
MTYRILTLDGGGSWALLQAMALKALLGDLPGRQILGQFDLAAANSGGSIVLGALIKDFKPSDIIALFRDAAQRQRIFSLLPLSERLTNKTLGVGPQYSTADKRNGLARVLGQPLADTAMKDLPAIAGPAGRPVRLVIIGFDYDRVRATFFRSYATRAGSAASPVPLADAINASSNAPVNYFDKPAKCADRRYWDGAIGGYNNPLMAAVVEALVDGAQPRDVVALSLGTATIRLAPRDNHAARGGLREPNDAPTLTADLAKLAGSIVDDPPDSASYTAYITLGNRPDAPAGSDGGSVVRLSPSVQPVLQGNQWVAGGLPDGLFDALRDMPLDAVDDRSVGQIGQLGDLWLAGTVPNQPLRMNGETLGCDLGDATFAAGAARWRTLTGMAAPTV